MKNTIQILILDDDAGIRDLLQSYINTIITPAKYGLTISILEAENVKAANGIMEYEQIHLAFLDVHLPDGHGMDVLRHIKHSHSETQVVMMSGASTKTMVAESIQLGVVAFLAKPFNRANIQDAISRFYHNFKFAAAKELA